MQPAEEFTGLGMPVFTAFGWAGEDTAQNYAFSQLEQFVALLHEKLPRSLKEQLPYYGLSEADQNAFLAASESVEDDLHIVFNVRPLSLEALLAITNKDAVRRALKHVATDPGLFLNLLERLGPNWTLRVQQMQVDEETGAQAHYQDVFKGPVADLTAQSLAEIQEKANYLNGDDKWVTPLYFSLLTPADQAAAMQKTIIPVMAERLAPLAPVVATLLGQPLKPASTEKAARSKRKIEAKVEAAVAAPVQAPVDQPVSKDEFVYLTELMPLHIQRGFVNLTP